MKQKQSHNILQLVWRIVVIVALLATIIACIFGLYACFKFKLLYFNPDWKIIFSIMLIALYIVSMMLIIDKIISHTSKLILGTNLPINNQRGALSACLWRLSGNTGSPSFVVKLVSISFLLGLDAALSIAFLVSSTLFLFSLGTVRNITTETICASIGIAALTITTGYAALVVLKNLISEILQSGETDDGSKR